VAEQLAQKSGSTVNRYGFLDNSGGFLPLFSLLRESGVDLLNTPASEVRLDTPEIENGVTRIQSLIDGGALYRPVYREGPSQEFVDPGQMIRDGKVAIWAQDFMPVVCDGPGCPPQQDTDYDFEIGKVPYPSTIPGFYSGGYDGYIISGGTAHPAEAWKWIEFLSRQNIEQGGPRPIDAGPYMPPGRVPARLSLAEETGFWNKLDPATAEAYKWAIANPGPSPERTPDYAAFGPLSQAVEQILGPDKKEPRKALQDAQKELERLLAETQLTPTPAPNTDPVVVATPEPQEAPEGATVVTFAANSFNPPELRRLARAFRDIRPDLFVQIKSTDVFTEAPTFKQLASTNDCFMWWNAPQTDEDFNALLDLQPLFDSDASFPIDDYARLLLAPYQHNGGLFGLPYAANLRTLNYNRTAFDAAGIQPPNYKWTPDDFLAAAQALTKGEGDAKQYGYIPLGSAQQDMFFFVNQFGGRLATGSGLSARPTFTDPKAIEGIKWYLDLSTVHKVTPVPAFPYRRDQPFPEDKSYEMVQNGRAGMWFDMGYGMFGGPIKGGDPNAPARDFEVGVGPLPIGQGGLTSGELTVRGFHISAQTQQAEGCWEWLKYLSNDVNNLQGGIPARTSVMASDAFKKMASPDVIALTEAYADAFKASSSSSSAGGDPSAFYMMDQYWFFKAISEAIEGKTPLDQGLADAQKFTTAYMDCLEKTPEKPATCASQADPDYQGYSTEDPQVGPGMPGIAVPRG
jgi:multiple sugar transport system substrate-binding protein